MRRRTFFGACALVLAWSFFGYADAIEFKHSEPPFVPVHNCTCRFNGEDVALGERRCLMTPQGPRSAECVMEQNVTSWRPSRDSCPQAALVRPRG